MSSIIPETSRSVNGKVDVSEKKIVYSPGLLPPERLGIAGFAAAKLIMPEGRAAGRPMRLEPFQVGIVEAVEDPAVEIVVLRCSSQVGKSTVALAVLGHTIGERPASALYIVPTETAMGGAFSRERLGPMIRQSPVLAEKFRGHGGRGVMSKLAKTWPGGFLAIIGANSPASLGARAVEVLLFDEIDKYPREVGHEGDVMAQALQRTVTYGRRRRVLYTSTPAGLPVPDDDEDVTEDEIRAISPIEAQFVLGDQCTWHVPCPACGREGPITWNQDGETRVEFDADNPAGAAVVCPCGRRWTESERVAAIGRGRWVAKCEPKREGRRSFYLWAGCSPYIRLSEVVDSYIEAEAAAATGDFALLRAWWQLKLGLPFDESIIGDRLPEIQQLRAALVARAGLDGEAPSELLRTAGMDVQGDRVEALLVAWGEGEEAWIVERAKFYGDTAEPADPCWVEAREWLKERRVARASCDSRYQPDAVATFAEATPMVAATKGRADGAGEIVQRPRLPDAPKSGRVLLDRGARATVAYWPVGVNGAKRLVMRRLARREPGPGFVHIPEWFGAAEARQLVSEREVRETDKHGRVRVVWVPVNRRNELLDMFILATHARRRKRSR